jgi:hypothetical protein
MSSLFNDGLRADIRQTVPRLFPKMSPYGQNFELILSPLFTFGMTIHNIPRSHIPNAMKAYLAIQFENSWNILFRPNNLKTLIYMLTLSNQFIYSKVTTLRREKSNK